MASQTIEIVECDRPGCLVDVNVDRWVIVSPDGATREIDLCERHSAPVADVLALGRPLVPAKPALGRRAKVRAA